MDGRAERTGRAGDPKDTDCRRAADLVPWVAAGSAPTAERVWLYRHLTGCPVCRTDLARAVALAVRVRHEAGGLPEVPPQVWERLSATLPPGPVATGEPADMTGMGYRREVVLLDKTLGVLEQAGLPRLALGPLRWALGWV